MGGKKDHELTSLPSVLGRGIAEQRSRSIIDEDVYLSIVANERVCKC
jgi:hypothetical protein